MPSVNERLADAAVSHAVDFAQFSNGVVYRIISTLNKVDADLAGALASALEQMDASSFSVERLESLLTSVRMMNAQAYAQVGMELTTELRALVDYETNYQAQLFDSVLPAQVVADVGIARVTVDQVYAAALSRPFSGRLLSEWSKSIEATRMARIRDTVRIGFVEGKTTDQIVRSVRGTRAKGYSDGIIEIDRRQAEAVIRTALSHTAGVARDRFNEANGDVIKAVRWVSTLDARTSELCRPRDGLLYTPEDHKPIEHKIPWLAGPGRLHWQALAEGTLVRTSRGQVPIELVRSGDYVLSHRGTFAPVVDIRAKRNESGVLRVVHTKAGRMLKATYDHPIVTADSGWQFVGTLELGDNLFCDAESLCEVIGGDAVFSAQAEDHPSVLDDTGVALKRTVQLVAADIDLECDSDVRSCEIENRCAELVLREPQRIKGDECAKHYLLALAHALKKLGRNRLGDLLADIYGNCASAQALGVPVEMAARSVSGNDAISDADHSGWVASEHALGMLSHSRMSLLGQTPRPMGLASRPCAMTESGINRGLLRSGADRYAVPASVVGQTSVGEVVPAFDVTQGMTGFDVLGNDERSEKRIRFSHDAVVSLELQHYEGLVYDLEVAGDASYVANGIAVSNCRSCSAPVTKSFRELGIDIDEVPPSERASMDGAIPSETTYNEWLSKQSAARQNQVLGPTRGALFRKGDLPMDAFYNQRGVWLSLDELRQRDAKAFAKAGV